MGSGAGRGIGGLLAMVLNEAQISSRSDLVLGSASMTVQGLVPNDLGMGLH